MNTPWLKRLTAGRLSRPLPPAEVPTGLWAQLRRNLPSYSVGVALLAAYNYCQYRIDISLAEGMKGLLGGDIQRTQTVGLWMLLLAVLAFGVRVLSRLTIFNAGRFAEYELRSAALWQLQRLGPSFYGRVTTGDIMSRVTNDLQQVRVMLGFGVLNSFNTSFALISALAVMLQFSPRLTAAALAPLPLLLWLMRYFGRKMFNKQRENQDALGDLGAQVQSSIAGVRVVRSFGLERAELSRFETKNKTYLDRALSLARLRGAMWPAMQAVTMLGVLVVFWFGGRLIVDGQLEAEQFLPFYRALYRLTWPLAAFGFVVSVVQRGRASYSRLQEVFSAKPDVVDGNERLETVRGQLEVRDLHFSYGGQPVLSGLSFQVAAGESVAIVGRTGAGKSTLGALITRLQKTPEGSIFLDGKDVCKVPLAELRKAVLFVQQTAFLFSTTVGRNVAYVLPEPDSDGAAAAVRGAAGKAQIRAEVEALPDGFDTIVGERGVQLSGGQKQRTALARSFLSRPQVLILDDPLSAVDARTESALLDALDGHRKGQTLLLITHRVSAAARCDRVIVVDSGSVVDTGTHAELASRPGLYRAFVEEQQKQSELEALGGQPASRLTCETATGAAP